MKKQTSLVHPRLQNKTAIVVGTSKGIGRSIAELFAEQGAKVLLVPNLKRSCPQWNCFLY